MENDACIVTIDATVKKIMPLGDSITDGAYVPGAYRMRLWDRIINNGSFADFVGSGSNGPAYLLDDDHEGHSGWRIDQIDAYINTWMDAYDPDTVLLHIGTNDILQLYDCYNMYLRLNGLISKVVGKLPAGGKLYVAKIIPIANAFYDLIAVTYNAQIDTLVSSWQNSGYPVYIVDMYSAVDVYTDLLSDGIHPNEGGFANMGDALFNAIVNDLD